MDNVPVYLTVNGNREVTCRGAKLTAKDGTIQVIAEFVPDESGSARLRIPDLGVNAQISNVSKLQHVSIVASEGENTIIPSYVDRALNIVHCKCCCTNPNTGLVDCVTGQAPCRCC
jgi:hypothetical protein